MATRHSDTDIEKWQGPKKRSLLRDHLADFVSLQGNGAHGGQSAHVVY